MPDLFSGLAAKTGYTVIAGVDEVGRGPLAGDVLAAAVVLGDDIPQGVTDSKKLTARRRESLAVAIKAQARAWCIARGSCA